MFLTFVFQQEFQQKMTWLVYMMGSLIHVTWLARAPRVVLLNGSGILDGRMEEDTGEDDNGHRLVGEMSSLVFGLIGETDKLVSFHHHQDPRILDVKSREVSGVTASRFSLYFLGCTDS